MGMLRVMSRRGDDRVIWDPGKVEANDPEAVAAIREAERIFNEEHSRGATAFKVEPGKPVERIEAAMTLEALSLFLGIWLLFLLLAIYYLSQSPDGRVSRLRESVSEHLSAESRAKALLREMLTENQYQQLIKFGYLEVPSPSIDYRVYRIPGSGGLVKVFERGSAVMELCLQPAEPLPDGDVVVMHKLMIEANEQEYLQKANHFAPGIISLRCQHL